MVACYLTNIVFLLFWIMSSFSEKRRLSSKSIFFFYKKVVFSDKSILLSRKCCLLSSIDRLLSGIDRLSSGKRRLFFDKSRPYTEKFVLSPINVVFSLTNIVFTDLSRSVECGAPRYWDGEPIVTACLERLLTRRGLVAPRSRAIRNLDNQSIIKWSLN